MVTVSHGQKLWITDTVFALTNFVIPVTAKPPGPDVVSFSGVTTTIGNKDRGCGGADPLDQPVQQCGNIATNTGWAGTKSSHTFTLFGHLGHAQRGSQRDAVSIGDTGWSRG